MTKYFCDICGEPASDKASTKSLEVKTKVKVQCDPNAVIYLNLNIGFQNHSTGFGGPPDLCKKCLHDLCVRLEKNIKSL